MIGRTAALAALSVTLPQIGDLGALPKSSELQRPAGAGNVQQVLGLAVSPQGKVERCVATLSSGSPAFDREVCGRVKAAILAPAKDALGAPAFAIVSLSLTWAPTGAPTGVQRRAIATDVDLTLQRLAPGPSDHPKLQLALSIGIDGRVESCSVVDDDGRNDLAAAACREGVAAAGVRPMMGPGGGAIRSVQSLVVGFGAYEPLIFKKVSRFAALGDAGPYFPERAQRLNVGGFAILRCQAETDGSLTGCVTREASPNDMGFGDAAQHMAAIKWMRAAPGGVRSVVVRVDYPASGRFRLP